MPKKGHVEDFEAQHDDYWSELQFRIGTKREEPDPAAVESAVTRLDSMMDRAFSTLDSLDKKAQAVAAVTAFLAGRIDLADADWRVVVVGVALACSGVLASALAVWSFSAMTFRSGAGPLDLAKKTGKGIDPLRRDQGIADALGVALKSAEVAIEVKSTRLNAALALAVVGILLLAVFAGTGGIK